ncbi:MAG: metal ABC transporter permease [Spirochaeta sp.]|nr:metal ABC transporter permease [Spirochaeta sp.]
MIWTSLDTWIVVAAALAGLASALVGSFLVLKKMSMMGDAISHAVLPGIAVAFILTSSHASGVMFLGAAVIGVLTAVLVQLVQRYGRLEQGAAMGVVFTVLFAVGLILIEQAAQHVDIHPEHVLFGAVELVPLYTLQLFGLAIPRGVAVLGVITVVNLAVVVLFFKELRLAGFDPALADALGIGSGRMHYLLMVLVALTTVAAFEVVGSILVIAMLIVPGATAHLLTKRLVSFLVVACGVAVTAAVLGHVAAALLTAPENGVIPQALTLLHRRVVVARQDILGLLVRHTETFSTKGNAVLVPEPTGLNLQQLRSLPGSPFPAGSGMLRLALITLRLSGSVSRTGKRYYLTPQGMKQAHELLRSHRLWERFFHDEGNVLLDELHPAADYLEHYTDGELREALAHKYTGEGRDPRGNKIPD